MVWLGMASGWFTITHLLDDPPQGAAIFRFGISRPRHARA